MIGLSYATADLTPTRNTSCYRGYKIPIRRAPVSGTIQVHDVQNPGSLLFP
jgi:hypothetical protein